jgi:Leucine-rich repeat (LRR) protein
MPDYLGRRITPAESAEELKLVFRISTVLFLIVLAVLMSAAELKVEDLPRWITAQGGRLERNEAGRVVAVDLESTWITDADLEKIGRLGSLRKLNLAHTKITDAGIEHLKALENVSDLNLYYAEYITDTALAHLKRWKRLEVLNLRGTRMTSAVFEHLAHLTGLRSLDIAFTEVDDDGFEQLSSLTSLESLALGGNRLSGSALSSLKLLPALRSLDAGGMQRVDSGRWGLALSDGNLARLSELTELRTLILTGANLNDRRVDRPGNKLAERSELPDISKLRSLRNLELLDLSRTPVLPGALAALRDLPRLRELRLGLATKIDDTAVETLISLTQLSSLHLGGTKVTPEGVERFRRERPDCQVTWWQ